MKRLGLALVALAGACAATPHGATTPSVVDIPLEGDANGLLWDGGALLVADFSSNRILRWDGNQAFTVLATIPVAGRPGLGQLVKLPDGRLVVTRFGHGETGSLFLVAPGGEVSEIPGLDPKRKRVGLAAAATGEIYDAYFVGKGDTGAIARVDPAGIETELLSGLKKPVGLLVHGEWLYISDQAEGKVVKCQLPACATTEPVAEIGSPDLLAGDAAGNLVVGTKDGNVYAISAAGKVELVASKLGRVRGVATDGAHRVFMAGRKDDRSFIRVLIR